jgi:cytokinin dehydrogenase
MHTTNKQHTLTRRSFVTSLATGALVIGFDPLTRLWITPAEAATGIDFDTLPPLDGTLHLDDATRDEYAQDYGQIIHERPRAVLKPGSVRDISLVVKFARRHGIRIAARGQGHLPYGQAQVEDGIVVDMRTLQTVHAIGDDRMEVDAGCQWRTVVETALARQLTPPILPTFLGLTVGGTLSIGGISEATYEHGAQVDNVFQLEVVTGNGEIVTCSEQQHRDLFEAALAGQGQCAIITRAVIRLVPAFASVREYALPYADLPALMRDGNMLAEDERFNGVSAFVFPQPDGTWRFFLVAISYWTLPDSPDDSALLSGLGFLAGAQQITDYAYGEYVDPIPELPFTQGRPDLALLVPGSAAADFVAAVLPRLAANDLGTSDFVELFFWKRSRFTRPLFRIPDEPTCVGFVTLRTPTSDPAIVERMLSGNRALFEQNRSLGGTHYPFSAIPTSRHDWKRHYGGQWGRLVRAKHRYDPGNIFASGPDIFGRND